MITAKIIDVSFAASGEDTLDGLAASLAFPDRISSEIVISGDTMKQNVHNVERVIRVIAGLAIISLVFVGPQSAWGWLGVIPLATGIIGWCPPYALFGFSTCKKPE